MRYLAVVAFVVAAVGGAVGVARSVYLPSGPVYLPPEQKRAVASGRAGVSAAPSTTAHQAADASAVLDGADQNTAAAAHTATSVQIISSSDSQRVTHTLVTVNGQVIAVPLNGSVSTHATGSGGDASVRISHSSSGDATGSSTVLEVTSTSGGQS